MPTTAPPADDTEMVLLTEDLASCASPPARLAARFYRKSSARRKSSANSSRRSSLSSIHSHHSSLSCHGGPHSTHIAQHLRRASIIESRKARLADRAAHAEQVRLRAAAAKATPRASYSEERALAAQAAREKLLAEITARCEEEVRRAKKIAEETKEKKAAEHAKLREELAEKFADAARRKSMYQHSQRKPRSTSLAAVEEKKINPVVLKKLSEKAAAKVLQRAWRARQLRRVSYEYQSLGLSLAHVANRTFEDLTKFITEDRTMKITTALLKHLNLLEEGRDNISISASVRVFLSAYLIVGHPVQTFSHGGDEPQEQELVTKANALLTAVERSMKVHSAPTASSNPSVNTDGLAFPYNDFSSAFHVWKSQDLEILIDVMVNSFANLDQIIQATKNDNEGSVADDYLQAVQQEQIKLLARLKRLAGPEEALSRVRVAVKNARKRRVPRKARTSNEHIPRAGTPTHEARDAVTSAPLTPPATPQPQQRSRNFIPTSFVSRLGQTMTVLPSNREIAHEIQINGIYEVQQQPWTDSRKHFMDSLRSSMRQNMQTGGAQAVASWTHAMAVLIREKLMALISRRHPLFDRIDGFLDPPLIEQQCYNGVFSYPSFFETIAGLIAQLCSPGRDAAVRHFASDTASDTIDRLFSLINIIDLMTLDHVNFQFRLAAHSVIEHGHEHEQAMFERDLQDGTHTLQRTKIWWSSARNALQSPAANGTAIYARGLADLVFSNSPMSVDAVPETLRLDYLRLLKLRARAMQIAAISSILLTTKIRLRRNREALWTKDAERLMSLDLLSVDAARIVSLVETSHMMPAATREGLLNFVSRVLPAAAAAAKNVANVEEDRAAAIQNQAPLGLIGMSADRISTEDCFGEQVATFILKSLREQVFVRLSASSTAEKVRATTGTVEVLARAGMPEFVGEVGSLVETLERIRHVDLKAHGQWYDRVARDIQGSG